jgi:mono/diheme cytochrome c family protein
MKKILRVIVILLLILVVFIGGAITYIKLTLPNVGEAPELKIDPTPERIERGRYLANSVTVCMDCHSTRDWSKFSGPLVPGTHGKGGEKFDQALGFPGVYYSRNITPAGISSYTDGELYRVITSGVDRTGEPLFPVMPYPYYGKMDDEDIYSIIAYIRTLAPIQSENTLAKSDFPMNIIINTIPAKGTPTKRPDPSDTIAYGGYMVNASGCIECHTQVEKGQVIKELAFSGGRDFSLPDGSVLRSANITPHKTGIGNWSKEFFLQRFKMYADSSYVPATVNAGEFNTIMPWTMYAHMTTEDLSSIYAYLKTVKPLENSVIKYTPPVAKQ